MPDSRRPSPSAAAEPATTDESTHPTSARSPQATVTVAGSDGTVLATISRHTESLPADDRTGSPATPLVVVEVVGDIDGETAPLLHTVVTHAVRAHPRVCCDVSRVAFLGADAVNTIIAALADADETGCAFTVRGVHGLGARVFRITGLTDYLAARA